MLARALSCKLHDAIVPLNWYPNGLQSSRAAVCMPMIPYAIMGTHKIVSQPVVSTRDKGRRINQIQVKI